MENSLISIIIPCYNVDHYLQHLLKSISQQDYPNVEIIIINDGSTDETLNVIYSFENTFKCKGYSYTILNQNNVGLANTINNGLKHIKGKYLIWPDADDWYESPTALSKMVNALENNPECPCVRVLTNYVNDNIKTPIKPIDSAKNELFHDFLNWNDNIWAPAGSHMIRTETLYNYYPNKKIFANRHGGQNLQLLLPILYHRKCLTIQEYLYNILVHKGSHSRGAYSTYKQEIERWKDSIELLDNTIYAIKEMPIAEQKICIKNIHKKYIKIMMNTAKRHRQLLGYIYFLTKFLYIKMK